jgi:hypothetical protein
MATLARLLIIGGTLLIIAGALVLLADRLGLHHLPGTFTWRRGGVTVVVPVGLMIVLSVVLSLALSLLFRR